MLRHFLASFPLVGRSWRFGNWPANGGSDTLAKTANAPTNRRHHSNLSSTARHISNLADPDANFFVLLGGQDGWPGSTTFLDQARMWRRGEYVQVPLRPETARATFPYTTELRP
jgi:penicillin amidase